MHHPPPPWTDNLTEMVTYGQKLGDGLDIKIRLDLDFKKKPNLAYFSMFKDIWYYFVVSFSSEFENQCYFEESNQIPFS